MTDEREIIFLEKTEPKNLSKVYEYQKVTHKTERLYDLLILLLNY